MRLDKLTIKAQEAVQASQGIAEQHSHQQIEPEHLLLALIQQKEGVVIPLLKNLGEPRPVEGRASERSLRSQNRWGEGVPPPAAEIPPPLEAIT